MLLPIFYEAVDGVANYTSLLAVYGLIDLKPSLLYFFTNPNEAGFTIDGGCIQMYNGMADWIGRENILLNARTINAVRPPSSSHHHVTLTIQLNDGVGDQGSPAYDGDYDGDDDSSRPGVITAKCQNLIVAFPENLDTIRFLNPDPIETLAYEDFSFRYWAAVEANVTGPIAEPGAGFTLYNWDLTQPFFLPPPPSVLDMSRGLPYGPAGSVITSEFYLTPDQARAVWAQQVANIPKSLLTDAEIVVLKPHAEYGPNAPANVLARQVNPYAIQRQIQGHRKTWWSSTTPGDNDSMLQWNTGHDIARAIYDTGRWSGVAYEDES